jgi:hypothetical protein
VLSSVSLSPFSKHWLLLLKFHVSYSFSKFPPFNTYFNLDKWLFFIKLILSLIIISLP